MRFWPSSLRGRYLLVGLAASLLFSLVAGGLVNHLALGYAHLAAPDDLQRMRQDALILALLLGAAALLAASLVSMALADGLSRSIRELASALKANESHGDLTRPLPPPSPGASAEILGIHAALAGLLATLARQREAEAVAGRALRAERERLARLERAHRTLLDAVGEHALVSATDPQGRITHVNERFLTVTGYAAEELLGKKHGVISSGRHAPGYYAALWQTLAAGRVWRGELCNRRKDGSLFWVDAVIVPSRDADGRPSGYTAVSLDVSDYLDTQRELRLHRDHLRELVAERTAELIRAKEAAESANAAKSEFMANITHELRTPLHAVINLARLAQGALRRQAGDEAAEYLDDIHAAGQRQLGLVDDLLDLAKIEAGKMRVSPRVGDVRPVLEAAARGMAALLRSKEITLVWCWACTDTLASFDADRLQQVLANLLSNAVKFSPSGGQLRLTLSDAHLPVAEGEAAPGRPALRIALKDQGVGIPADELDRIFEPFAQSSRTNKGAGGTGLGLTICREIMGLHQGCIRAENNPDGGATFSLLLPRAPEALNPAAVALGSEP